MWEIRPRSSHREGIVHVAVRKRITFVAFPSREAQKYPVISFVVLVFRNACFSAIRIVPKLRVGKQTRDIITSEREKRYINRRHPRNKYASKRKLKICCHWTVKYIGNFAIRIGCLKFERNWSLRKFPDAHLDAIDYAACNLKHQPNGGASHREFIHNF